MHFRLTLATLAMTVAVSVPTYAAPPGETSVDVVAAYAIDNDTFDLVRYAFGTDMIMIVGKVRTAGGDVVEQCESLAYIGQGPDKGMYSVSTKGDYERQLVKIDPLTAIATVYAPVMAPSDRKITGMISEYDSGLGRWFLLAALSEDTTSDPDAMEKRTLIRIDPATGMSSIVATEAQLGDGRRFEGLGIDSNGDLYATSRTHFYRIHQEAGYWVEELGATGLDKAEAFEIAFGDNQPSIDVPGVNPSWTKFGVFFVYDEQLAKFGVLNPANGSFVEFLVDGNPSSFLSKDAEGMILLTFSRDPLYGSLAGFD